MKYKVRYQVDTVTIINYKHIVTKVLMLNKFYNKIFTTKVGVEYFRKSVNFQYRKRNLIL